MSRFKQAQRTQSRLRMAIDGPPKSGKSFNSLMFAHALARLFYPDQPTNRLIAVIDTERGSASKYVGERDTADPDAPPWDFFVCELAKFTPTEYTAAIHDAEREGFKILIIDSLSHAWAGKDGALELKDRSGDTNAYTAWRTITPMHNEMVESILQSPCHVFATMRSKVETVMVDGVSRSGQPIKIPQKVGMAPVQRQGMEYEFDIYTSMDTSHVLTVGGSRCRALDGAIVALPSGSFMQPVAEWLTTGKSIDFEATARKQRASREQVEEIVRLSTLLRKPRERFEAELVKRYGVSEVASLRPEQAEELIIRLTREAESQAPAPTPAPAPRPAPQPQPDPEPTPPPAPTPSGNGQTTGNGPATADADQGQTLQDALADQQATDPAVVPSRLTDSQLDHLKSLISRLNVAGRLSADDVKKDMKIRKVTRVSELSEKQAEAYIQKLGARVNELNQTEARAATAVVTAGQQEQEGGHDPN